MQIGEGRCVLSNEVNVTLLLIYLSYFMCRPIRCSLSLSHMNLSKEMLFQIQCNIVLQQFEIEREQTLKSVILQNEYKINSVLHSRLKAMRRTNRTPFSLDCLLLLDFAFQRSFCLNEPQCTSFLPSDTNSSCTNRTNANRNALFLYFRSPNTDLWLRTTPIQYKWQEVRRYTEKGRIHPTNDW